MTHIFIRKKKVVKEINDMIEDLNYWIRVFRKSTNEDSGQKIQCFKTGIDELETLKYFLNHNKRWRPLRSIKEDDYDGK